MTLELVHSNMSSYQMATVTIYIVEDAFYETTLIAYACNIVNKIIQAMLFTVHYIYYYKYNKLLKSLENASTSNDQE